MKNSFFNRFTPKEPKFFPLLKQLSEVLSASSVALVESLQHDQPTERSEYYKKIKDLEREGDRLTHLIFDELGTTFITPFDREDIHDLASCMDDVIDGINSCAKRISIYNPRPISESGKELSRLIQELLRLGGADGVAAYGVIMYVSFIFAAIFIGYAQGCAPVVSYHYGADNTDELKNLLRISLRVIAVGGVAMLCFSELLAAPLSRFFVGYDAELLELTTLGMKLYSLSFLLCGFNIFGSAFFTALNNGIVSAVISFLRTLVFQVTAILVLPHLLGMNGIWLSVVAAEIAALFVNAFFLVKNRKKYQY